MRMMRLRSYFHHIFLRIPAYAQDDSSLRSSHMPFCGIIHICLPEQEDLQY